MASKKPTKAKKATKKGPKNPEAMRKQLMEDPDTQGIAQSLGVELEAYVDQVIHYVMNPGEDPELYTVPDDDLRAMGLEPPSQEDIGRHIIEGLSASPDRTDYRAPKKKLINTDLPPSAQSHGKTDRKLEEEVRKQIRVKRTKT